MCMPIKRKIPYDSGHFFITFTCYNWLPLIDITNSYDLVYNWFDVLKNKDIILPAMLLCPIMYMLQLHFEKRKKASIQ